MLLDYQMISNDVDRINIETTSLKLWRLCQRCVSHIFFHSNFNPNFAQGQREHISKTLEDLAQTRHTCYYEARTYSSLSYFSLILPGQVPSGHGIHSWKLQHL
jgi:hypothetical protein